MGFMYLRTFEDPANKWLVAAEPKLGNAITEVAKTGPRELTLIRRSDLGLSALELFALVQWIAGPPAEEAFRVPASPETSPPAKP